MRGKLCMHAARHHPTTTRFCQSLSVGASQPSHAGSTSLVPMPPNHTHPLTHFSPPLKSPFTHSLACPCLPAGKKCLVLDIDYTLFDLNSSAERPDELARPYLHEFLSSAYQHYDIVIWSATGMKWVEVKMKVRGPAGVCCCGLVLAGRPPTPGHASWPLPYHTWLAPPCHTWPPTPHKPSASPPCPLPPHCLRSWACWATPSIRSPSCWTTPPC
jgi:hypothetical protein